MFTRSQQKELGIVLHQGTYKKTATLSEAVFMITGMTIGAGILGVPYVVAQVGLIVGVAYIIALGIVMLGLNLMIGELASASGENLQLPGLAGKYVGRVAKDLVSITLICRSYGALLAYIIGEGLALAAIFGGSSRNWSIVFWSVGSFLIWGGLERVKKVEKILSFTVIFLIVTLSLFVLPYFDHRTISFFDSSSMLLPFGVILFALSATPAIVEVHALLPGDDTKFRRALIIGTSIPVLVYVLFAVAVVGALGGTTTQIATIGLGTHFGRGVLIIANLFAVLAMCTGFMGVGTALRETLSWDHHLPRAGAKFLVIAVPFILFFSGFQNFITILGIAGGLFITLESIIMVAVYTAMRRALHPQHTNWLWPITVASVLVIAAGLTVWQLWR